MIGFGAKKWVLLTVHGFGKSVLLINGFTEKNSFVYDGVLGI